MTEHCAFLGLVIAKNSFSRKQTHKAGHAVAAVFFRSGFLTMVLLTKRRSTAFRARIFLGFFFYTLA
jgi:hypothetical protein